MKTGGLDYTCTEMWTMAEFHSGDNQQISSALIDGLITWQRYSHAATNLGVFDHEGCGRGMLKVYKSLGDLRSFSCNLNITADAVLPCFRPKPRRWARTWAPSLIRLYMTVITKGRRPHISRLHLIRRYEKYIFQFLISCLTNDGALPRLSIVVILVNESARGTESKWVLKVIFPDLFILGKLVCPSFWEGQATGVAGTSLAQSQAEVASVA